MWWVVVSSSSLAGRAHARSRNALSSDERSPSFSLPNQSTVATKSTKELASTVELSTSITTTRMDPSKRTISLGSSTETDKITMTMDLDSSLERRATRSTRRVRMGVC